VALPAVPATEAERARLLARAATLDEDAIRRLERARSLPGGRYDPSILRTLGDAYLAAREPRHADAEEAYRATLSTKTVRLRGRRVPVAKVGEDDLAGVVRTDRIFVADTLGNRSKAVGGLQESERSANYAAWAAKWDPWSYERQRLAGAAWMRLEHPTDALPYLEAAARLAPRDERGDARRQYEEAQKLVREQSETHFSRGLEARSLPGRERDALEEFLDALRVRPNFVRAWLEAGKLLGWWKGNLADGMSYVERAKTLQAEAVAHGEKDDPALSAEIDRELEKLRAAYRQGDEPPAKAPPR
jgi:tetratricopeptide (TPR) repeat protein